MNSSPVVAAWHAWVANAGYIWPVVDIIAVAFVIYKLMMLVKGTRAWQIMWGLAVFFLLVFASDYLRLRALNWLLNVFVPLGPVALVILFYPELRHALEEIGRLRFLGKGFGTLEREDIADLVDQLTRATADMARAKTGALIVLERDVGLDNIIATGNELDAVVSADLLKTIFHPGSPLHDGAVVIRGNRIVAASCTLPLSENPRFGTMIHTRHKAAVGVAEQSDAIVLVVSEETGTISMATEGQLHRGLSVEDVRAKLADIFQLTPEEERKFRFGRRVSSAFSRFGLGSALNKKRQ